MPFSHTQKWNHSKDGVLFYRANFKFWNSLTKIQILGGYQNWAASKSSASAPHKRASKPVWSIATHYLPRVSMHAIISLTHTIPQIFFFLVSSDLIWNACSFSCKVPNGHLLPLKLSDVASDHRKLFAVWLVKKNKVQGCPLLYTCKWVAGITTFT